ncbi:Uu.00g136050.m01.CDS01 [Anthostomella pinea]|uniref:Oxidation resistance protein 1 n=1 Tax=Anthostomella pinea TaxID=933095 RepID=A0AAI8VPB2_9PEZI|nr:Uu.00g136050.m01.CDS01 [Anthostomella pinea]
MNRHDTVNLIDLEDSPPPSGVSTPLSTSQTPSQSQSQSQPRSRYASPSSQLHSSPSPPQSQTPSQSGSYGIGSAVFGFWRRISALDSLPTSAPTPPLPTSQLYHLNAETTTGDGVNGPFVPPPSMAPRRTASPRGLPSLEPLTLSGYRPDTDADERLLSRGIAEEIRTFLPERLKIMEDWHLTYSLYQNGSSLSTLYQLCEEYRGRRAGFVLVVRDGKDGTFGAYLTEAPHPAASYYGTGECFLWRASLHAPLPPPPSADTTDLNYRTTTIASPTSPTSPASTHLSAGVTDPKTNKLPPTPSQPQAVLGAQSIRFQNFAYTGANDYCMFSETKFLSVGGGSGTYGLWLNDSLSRGHSATCDTFLNQPLSEEGEKFDVMGVELWVVGAT